MNVLSPEVERRRRLVTRALPLSVVAVFAFAWGASTGAGGSPEKDVAARFAAAWERKDFDAMYRELNAASRQAVAAKEFAAAYRETAEVATLRGLAFDDPDDPARRGGATVVPVATAADTVSFGRVEADLELPVADGGVAWDPSLVFPGLQRGEHLESRVELAPRAAILAVDRTPLAEGPAVAREHPIGSAAIDVSGEVGTAQEEDLPLLARHGFPPGTPVGVSGIEQAFNTRLAGKPGGTLLAVGDSGGSARILAEAKPRPGAPVKTTIDP
ncbi:MAG TPA: NTF2-like N-terminal transpeptidase domain-containing protein, partial [Solirubrobacterales bacterium]|nr:NTF2-like N-terminal transpeptidase domain-containing protein [Solirubrobacterales bacterium]